ncbi:MAG: nucleotidyltransferase family protein [Oribacterium sinus]|uniref:Nucleotidyltransferase family protein n=2 Tax=Oribacterium sinus TaxID=237576 RepID=A0A930DMS9_9FIRM|nr:nucleotidyltransferase family protein [Oribacterium sinus]
MRRMNWGRLYRIADYHELASGIYLGMLSAGARVPSLFGEKFFHRYQEAVRYGEIYESSELEILGAFQAVKVPAVVLESAAVRRLYHLPETAANSPLRLYIPEERYYMARGYLFDLGYETDQFYTGFGEHMKRAGGFQVEIYHHLPFLTKNYKKHMKSLLDRAYPDKKYPVLKVLSLESSYMFRMAEACYHFCTDNLKIRELLDLYLFYKLFHKDMNKKFLDARIKELDISLLSQSLLHMADMWFSSRKDSLFPYPKDSISLFDDMESRILSNGMVGADSIPEAAKLRKAIKDAENKEERAAKWRKWKEKWKNRFDGIKKQLRWIFPESSYMKSLYPGLENAPFLLPLYWIRRDFKLIRIMMLPDKLEEPKGENGGEKSSETKGQSTGGVGSIEAMSYQDDPFRKNGRKKVFYKGRRNNESEALSTNSVGESEAEEEELPLYKDTAFLQEEVEEEDLPLEKDENQETEGSLWDFKVPPRLAKEEKRPEVGTGNRAEPILSPETEALLQEAFAKMEAIQEEEKIKAESEDAESNKTAAGLSEEQERLALAMLSAMLPEEEAAPLEETSQSGEKIETAEVDGKEVSVKSWSFPKDEK